MVRVAIGVVLVVTGLAVAAAVEPVAGVVLGLVGLGLLVPMHWLGGGSRDTMTDDTSVADGGGSG